MKKRFGVLMAVLLALSVVLAACGGSGSSSGGGAAGSSSPSPSAAQGGQGGGEKPFQGLRLKAATHDQKTASYVFTTALAEIMREQDGVIIDVLPYAGGIGNIPLVNNGEADFGISFNIAAKWGKEGIVAFEEPHENIAALGAPMGYYNIGIIVRKDFKEKHDLKSLADIKEKKIPVKLITNNPGALAEVVTRVTLDAYGLSYDEIKSYGGSVELTTSDVIISQMQSGAADMFITTYSAAHATITELSLLVDIDFIPITEPEVKDKLADLGFIRDSRYNAAEYGVNQEFESPGFNVNYIISLNVDEDVAYLLAKRLSENKEALANAHAIMHEFDPAIAGYSDINGIPLHPGARRYYEEVGAVDN